MSKGNIHSRTLVGNLLRKIFRFNFLESIFASYLTKNMPRKHVLT